MFRAGPTLQHRGSAFLLWYNQAPTSTPYTRFTKSLNQEFGIKILFYAVP